MAESPGRDRREFLAGTVALTVAGENATAREEVTMVTTKIDGLLVNYVTRGKGPALLMLAPGGFDATMEK